LTNSIIADRKAIWMDMWEAGCFLYEYWCDYSTVWMASGPQCFPEQLANDTWFATPSTENEIIDQVTYYHGEFDFHIYSCASGKSPTGSDNYCGTLYSTADVNADQIVSMQEIWDWAYSRDDGEWTGANPDGNMLTYAHNNNVIANTTSLEYPTLLHTTYNEDKTWRGLIGVSKSFHVTSGRTLTFMDNSIVHLLNDADITIDQGASLLIEDNVTFVSKSGSRKMLVNGNISIGDNVSFLADEGADIRLEIYNTSLISTFYSGTFERAVLQSNQNTLNLTNCDFTESFVIFTSGSLNVNHCTFDDACITASNAVTEGKQITITNNCAISNPGGWGVRISNYPQFLIQNSSFSSSSHGIELYNSGNGRVNSVINNDITNNGTGIQIYNSTAKITSNNLINNGNYISNNTIGINCLDRSHVSIVGYSSAHEVNETQLISSNDQIEITASEGSFPCPFNSNAIIDEDNHGNPYDPLIEYTGAHQILLDVRRNFWGANFDYSQDLKPAAWYLWQPVWELEYIYPLAGPEALYSSADAMIEQENYDQAKPVLKQLVNEFPGSLYAEAALKKLYTIEGYSGSYSDLKEYYVTNNSIQSDSSLTKLADFLVNFCEINLENYPTAIAWFENVIQNPESFEDSIFAIIDLGFTYFLMENGGLKSSYVGNMPQYKPVSVEQFEENRDYLLSLLPGDKLSETMKESINALKTGELLQNVPNPFNGSTQIWYKLDEEADVMIKVFDYTGKEVKSFHPGTMYKGSHQVEFNSEGLPSGIYFYTLEINSTVSDSKKMTLLK
jgi:hypothetical protein